MTIRQERFANQPSFFASQPQPTLRPKAREFCSFKGILEKVRRENFARGNLDRSELIERAVELAKKTDENELMGILYSLHERIKVIFAIEVCSRLPKASAALGFLKDNLAGKFKKEAAEAMEKLFLVSRKT